MPGRSDARAYLGLGGNLGDPVAAMAAALTALDLHPSVKVVAVSSLYRTPPWGVTEQPDFVNAVAAVETSLSPRELLDLCLAAERALKRVRDERWGPRVIDIDILLFDDSEIEEEGLHIPHPRMTQRAFVLAPLAEISPELAIEGETVTAHLSRSDRAGIVRLDGGRDWWKS